jgi:hypothetical protein
MPGPSQAAIDALNEQRRRDGLAALSNSSRPMGFTQTQDTRQSGPGPIQPTRSLPSNPSSSLFGLRPTGDPGIDVRVPTRPPLNVSNGRPRLIGGDPGIDARMPPNTSSGRVSPAPPSAEILAGMQGRGGEITDSESYVRNAGGGETDAQRLQREAEERAAAFRNRNRPQEVDTGTQGQDNPTERFRIALPNGEDFEMSLSEFDSGGWRRFEQPLRNQVRAKIVNGGGSVAASGGLGTPTGASAAVNQGLGAVTTANAQAAQAVGFDDAQVRNTQQNLLQSLLNESESMGREASENLALPAFERNPLEGALETFLQEQMARGFSGDDAITQANLADFDANSAKARAQQIEDLQRFGVLGGEGTSAGGVADVLGEFDSGIQRGRGQLQAEGQRNLLNSILPQTQSLAQFQGDLANNQRQYEGNYNLQRTGMEQDVANQAYNRRLPLTSPTGTQQFQEGIRQAGLDRALQEAGLFGTDATGHRQTLGLQSLNQQDRQFDRSAGQQDTALANQLAQILGKTATGQETLGGRAAGQQDTALAQQLASLLGITSDGQQTLAGQQLGQQGEQFDLSRQDQINQFTQNRNLEIGQILGTLGSGVLGEGAANQRTLAGQQLDSANEAQQFQNNLNFANIFGQGFGRDTLGSKQIERQNQLDTIAQLLALGESDATDINVGTRIQDLLKEMFGVGSDRRQVVTIDGDNVVVDNGDGTTQTMSRRDAINLGIPGVS